jgi:steroid 5-alpha reductase family enzyme
MLSFSVALACSVTVSFAGAFLLWLVSIRLKDVSIVDAAWGLGFVVVAWTIALFQGVIGPNRWMLLAVLTIWGVRLSAYILIRNHGKPEDYRYAAMRRRSPANFWWWSLFKVFWLQAALVNLISFPVVLALTSNSEAIEPLIIAGLIVWLIGFVFEAGGDWQLSRFKKNPENRGKIMTSGLWSLTRHPNYFGDATQWWGLTLTSLGLGAPWWVLISPVIMNFFLVQVSGAKLLEDSAMSQRPGYAEYAAKTPRFLPKLPKFL